MEIIESVRRRLGEGMVIPACPLALTAKRKLDERRQRGLIRYYLAADAGGVAVGVHSTQFAIRDPKVGLFKPVLELAAEELGICHGTEVEALKFQISNLKSQIQSAPSRSQREEAAPFKFQISNLKSQIQSAPSRSPHREEAATFKSQISNLKFETQPSPLGIAGICGPTQQAVKEAILARKLGYGAGLLSLGAFKTVPENTLIAHCQAISEIIPLFGFYLQPAAGGRILSFSFWRRFAEIKNVVAVKIAPFNRYQSLDVIRAIAESGRDDISLYTGNDDNIVMDLLTPFRFRVRGKWVERHIVGGLLGHWAVWTKKAVELHAECRRISRSGKPIPVEMFQRNVEVTDANAAFFDAANAYAGCIPGIHEVLRRQGLLNGIWCLDAKETLSSGQREEIDRVYRAYPHLNDDDFVAEHREEWLSG